MRWQSEKSRKRAREAKPVRQALLAKHDLCLVCEHGPRHPWRDKPPACSRLCVHEIADGKHRQNALDLPCALLVVCWWCNSESLKDASEWPEARQLSLMQKYAPEQYDLAAYNRLVDERATDRITQAEVDSWTETLP